MIDLHCHILPGVDDGSKSLEMSLEMARLAVADGIKAIVATPHTMDGVYENRAPDILQRVEAFQRFVGHGLCICRNLCSDLSCPAGWH